VVTGRLSVTGAVATAYRDLRHALDAMRMLAVSALLIILAVKIGESFVSADIWDDPILGGIAGLVASAVQNLLLTPFMIAVHRFIIFYEETAGYILDPTQPRFWAYFGWLMGLSLITSLAFSLYAPLNAVGLPTIAATMLTIVLLAVVLILALRLSILFPAIAVDAPGTSAAQALADTKGHVFRIFAIFLLALLPFAALAIVITLLLGPGVMVPGTPAAMVDLLVSAVIQTLTIPLCVVIASRIFQALADRVSRPPAPGSH
jgi:hypothetical protein